jgi:spore maturation protein SpmA
MVLNYIWIGFFLLAFIVALLRVAGYYLQQNLDWFSGMMFDAADRDVFKTIVDSTFSMAETSVKYAIVLIGIMTLWLGIMKIGEQGGAINVMARLTAPLFKRLFPDLPKNHPAMGAMLMNICANMLGLDNAATPMGLKAMDELQKLNKTKDTASNAQIMFLVLNTSGLTIIPISILAYRASAGSTNPTDVFIPLLIATFFSTLVGLITVSIIQRIKLYKYAAVWAYLGGFLVLIGSLLFYLQSKSPQEVEVIMNLTGNFLLFFVIIFFLFLGIRKKINIYESFIDGAKEGFQVAIKIIPYLVAMLVGIGVFRASGTMDWIIGGIGKGIAYMGFDTSFVPALPTAFMKPLSGSGARGMMLEAFGTYGVDSFVGKLASIFQGSTETTFFVVAVYYGAVNIRKTRYTITAGLIADLAGIIAAIFISYMFFK